MEWDGQKDSTASLRVSCIPRLNEAVTTNVKDEKNPLKPLQKTCGFYLVLALFAKSKSEHHYANAHRA